MCKSYYSEDNRKIDLKEYNKYLDNLDNIMEKINGAVRFMVRLLTHRVHFKRSKGCDR